MTFSKCIFLAVALACLLMSSQSYANGGSLAIVQRQRVMVQRQPRLQINIVRNQRQPIIQRFVQQEHFVQPQPFVFRQQFQVQQFVQPQAFYVQPQAIIQQPIIVQQAYSVPVCPPAAIVIQPQAILAY